MAEPPTSGPPADRAIMLSNDSVFPERGERWSRLAQRPVDVAIVGGGINGAGIALDLTLRGLRVALFERGDYGSATSSASSRLIHGGLRYLEHYQFGFVREALRERAILHRLAPELVRVEPFFFALRHEDRVNPLMLRCGMWLYGALALPHPWIWPHSIARARFPEIVPGATASDLKGLFAFADGATHDARLVFALITAAARRGAITLSRAEVAALHEDRESARLTVRDRLTNTEHIVRTRCAVLTVGPLTDLVRQRFGRSDRMLATTRGTHIVVRRERLSLPMGSTIFTSPLDGRVMFLLRWGEFVAIGTTDLDADPSVPARPTWREVDYLLASANALVRANLREDDVTTAVAGLRPLLRPTDSSEGRAATRSREEQIVREGRVFTIAGGKLTGFRAIAAKLGPQVARLLGDGRRDDVWRSDVHVADATAHSREAVAAFLAQDHARAERALVRAIAEEEVVAPTDLLMRRSDLIFHGETTVERAIAHFADVFRSAAVATSNAAQSLENEWRRELSARSAWRTEPKRRQ